MYIKRGQMAGWYRVPFIIVVGDRDKNVLQEGGIMNIAKFYIRAEYFLLGLRDRFGIPFNPREELNKLDIREGQIILDYGCGIGSYTFPITKLVGNSGRVYALDKEPVAVTRIEEEAKKQGLRNIITILSDRETSLRDDSVDVVLFYGVLPEIKDKESVLRELHRVLKPDGYLSTRFCFRIKKDRILEIMESAGFSLTEQKGHILNFRKCERVEKIL